MNRMNEMNEMCRPMTIGAIFGFIIFVGLLESNGMGKILIRDGQFTPGSLLKYLKSPFHQRFLWYPQMWRHNWILMTGGGALVGALLKHFTDFL